MFRRLGDALGILDYIMDEESEMAELAEWRRFVLSFSRATPTGTTEDLAQFGVDVINLTGDAFDSSWTATDHNDVSQKLTAFWTSIKPLVSNELTLASIKAYRRKFAVDMTPASRFQDSGPPLFVDNLGVAGTNVSNSLPYQVAMSVTLKTGAPKHWGRFYVPGLSEAAITTKGRWDSAAMTTMSTAAGVLANELQNIKFPMVVASTQIDGVLTGSLFGVTSIQVDDIPDVIRRRRPRTTAIRQIVTVS